LAVTSRCAAAYVYEIPITFLFHSSRNPTPTVPVIAAYAAEIPRVLDANQDWYRHFVSCCRQTAFMPGSLPMMDIVMLAIAFVCFALSIGYVYACDHL
jgi:hypothetical protein